MRVTFEKNDFVEVVDDKKAGKAAAEGVQLLDKIDSETWKARVADPIGGKCKFNEIVEIKEGYLKPA